jgi:hypothetical protein
MYLERFKKLARLLKRTEDLWRQRPFVELPVPWEAEWPALSAALRALSPDEIVRFESAPSLIPSVRAAIPALIDELEALTVWPALPSAQDALKDLSPPKRVHARKWRQVTAFVATVSAHPGSGVTRWVDWCSGKGHLGRALSWILKVPVTCVEKKPSLCESGKRESELADIPLTFACHDVLEGSAEPLLDDETGIAALHACGHLNVALMRQGLKRQVPFMALIPCCFQRIDGMHYRPLSQAALEHDVPLTRHQLRLPSLDETMTSEKRRAKRRKEHAFRLGLDLLQREASGVDTYHPLGPIKPALLKGDFAHFAKAVAKDKKVTLPKRVDWQRAENEGWHRFHRASALGLARGLFRRALESWLVLDRALFLQEMGYHVKIGTFCPRDLTPRNLMIAAHRDTIQILL